MTHLPHIGAPRFAFGYASVIFLHGPPRRDSVDRVVHVSHSGYLLPCSRMEMANVDRVFGIGSGARLLKTRNEETV